MVDYQAIPGFLVSLHATSLMEDVDVINLIVWGVMSLDDDQVSFIKEATSLYRS